MKQYDLLLTDSKCPYRPRAKTPVIVNDKECKGCRWNGSVRGDYVRCNWRQGNGNN